MIIVLSFEYAGLSNAEEFADGKYFASVTDSFNVRWHIIVEKSGSSLKVISLNSEPFQSYDKMEPAVDLTEKLGTLELDEDLEYDSSWVRMLSGRPNEVMSIDANVQGNIIVIFLDAAE